MKEFDFVLQIKQRGLALLGAAFRL